MWNVLEGELIRAILIHEKCPNGRYLDYADGSSYLENILRRRVGESVVGPLSYWSPIKSIVDQGCGLSCYHPSSTNTHMSSLTEISVSSPADFHVHLRQGPMSSLVTPHVREGGFSLAYVMVRVSFLHPQTRLLPCSRLTFH